MLRFQLSFDFVFHNLERLWGLSVRLGSIKSRSPSEDGSSEASNDDLVMWPTDNYSGGSRYVVDDVIRLPVGTIDDSTV